MSMGRTPKLKPVDTQVGGVLRLTKGKESITVLVEKHRLIPITTGWEAGYFGPNDVEALEIRLAFARKGVSNS